MSTAAVQTKPETLMHHLLEGTSSKTGGEFFQALVHAAAQALDVAGVWVTEYLPEERVLRSLSFWLNGEFVKHFEYKIQGTPCELVVDQARVVHYPERIIELFPEDPDLVKLNAVSFVGVPFTRSDGRVIGHLAAVDTKPMKLTPELESAFQIFAARAGAEFRRIRAEAKIRESEMRLSRLFESAMDAIFELDEDFSIQRANGSAVALFGAPGKMLTDQKLPELLAPASAQKLAAVAKELDSECQRYAWVPGGLDARKADGSTFAAEATVSQFEVNGQRRYSLILRNVQDQLAAENRLRELQEEAAYLWSEINELQYGSEILGNSPAIREMITAIHQVGPTPATVFVSGETGTGKELVARAIHKASNRAGKAFIRVNCAAIPAALSESEFFGHERGAFTGAATRRTGRFELANGGTIFLDEVGEMPMELQPKLLRVLQEGEFEPVGSSQTRKVDVRVIAATNRDLAEEVASGRFREDLFYRLHVFPIAVPPLRDRGSDVEMLADDLLKRNCKRMGKALLELTADCLRRLRSYHWPGNVRELENVIERAVIIARDGHLNLRDVLPLENLHTGRNRKNSVGVAELQTKDDLREAEKATLTRALEESKWKVSGLQGAAQKLGIPPSTLSSRMKVLGIQRPR
jgi:PAS domain S-box-containing protein